MTTNGLDLTIAIGENEKPVAAPDPATQEFDHVERCFVRPLGVLEHENRWAQLARQEIEEGLHHRPAISLGEGSRQG